MKPGKLFLGTTNVTGGGTAVEQPMIDVGIHKVYIDPANPYNLLTNWEIISVFPGNKNKLENL